MTSVISAARTPAQNIAQLVLDANPVFAALLQQAGIFLDSSVTLSNLQVLSGAGPNSKCTLTAKPDTYLTGTMDVSYFRLSLADAAVVSPSIVQQVQISASDAQADILAAVAGALGFVQSEVSLSGNYTRPSDTSNNPTTVVTLTANAGSYLYLPGTSVAVTLEWLGNVDLSGATVTTMSGFISPNSVVVPNV